MQFHINLLFNQTINVHFSLLFFVSQIYLSLHYFTSANSKLMNYGPVIRPSLMNINNSGQQLRTLFSNDLLLFAGPPGGGGGPFIIMLDALNGLLIVTEYQIMVSSININNDSLTDWSANASSGHPPTYTDPVLVMQSTVANCNHIP